MQSEVVFLTVVASCLANLRNVTVLVNNFVEDSKYYYMPSFQEYAICDNCTVLYNVDVNSLEKYMGITLINTTVRELEENDIHDLLDLRELEASSTGLEILRPGCFANLPKLKYLHLEKNNLTEIIRGVFNNLSVTILSLNGNQIERIEAKAFENMTSLTILSLSENKLCKIENHWFGSINNLKTFQLSWNKIKDVPDRTFENCKRLKELDLANNNITHLSEDSLIGMRQLKLVNLSNNRIQSIADRVFMDQQSTLEVLYVCNNPLDIQTAKKLKAKKLLKSLQQLFMGEIDYNGRINSTLVLKDKQSMTKCSDVLDDLTSEKSYP